MSKANQVRESFKEAARVKLLFSASDKLRERGEAALKQLEATRSAGGVIRIFSDPQSRWSAHHFNEELVVSFKAGSPFGRPDREAINARQYSDLDPLYVVGLIEANHFDSKSDTLVLFSASAICKDLELVTQAAKRNNLPIILVAAANNTDLLKISEQTFSLPTSSRALIYSFHNLILHSFCEKFEAEYNADLHDFSAMAHRSAEVDLLLESQAEILATIAQCSSEIDKRTKSGATVFLAGNGGSTCDANTLASYLREPGVLKDSIEILDLHAADTLLCAYNDNHSLFARQIMANARKGDVFIAYSTSGNSQNIIDAVQIAKSKDVYTIGLLGKGGGKLAALCDASIIVPSNETARVQEAHALIGPLLFGIYS